MNKTLSALVPLNETRKRRGRTRKGDACAHCRLKKRKCDARKPICTSCHAEGFTAGCDYTPLKLRPRTEFYEEKIRLLEEQIDRYLRPRDSPEEFSPYGVFPVSMSPQHSAIVLTLPYAKRSPSVPSYNSVIRSLGSWTGDLAKLPPSGLCAHIVLRHSSVKLLF
ncbi:hypothetical protein BOTBODRAFT_248391 [Botryobasidium botryosum FD-172 SS1]|uniref:Zn(2)-C6 fungal-type domain-containing protein n=1 Tax=Botryobasidium botryosum (strain FD-172 SS1) TaxID=930990 RepID=A0A067MNZ2_BOTB1|nr:hypothetical protein BOTBODRAFT_248391 [Botryobasidium botryosum FD-172 SS1]